MIRLFVAITAFTLLGAGPALAVVFDHDAHQVYIEGVPCATCHVEGAYSIVPDKAVCLECHEKAFAEEVEFVGLKTHGPLWAFGHRPAAKGESIDCSSCHQQDFCLECHKSGFADEQGDFGNSLGNIHRSDFQVSHPIAARTDPQLCASCHEPSFCSDCHDDFAPADLRLLSHRRGFSDIAVGTGGLIHDQFDESSCLNCHPNSVLPSHEWSSSHAREARRNLATCQACHPQGDVCLTCHSARTGLRANPHPDDWGDIDDRLDGASDGRSCRKCH